MYLVPDRFDFPVPRNTTAFVCTRVRDGGSRPYVTHDEGGEWQFLRGGAHPDSGEDNTGTSKTATRRRRPGTTRNEVTQS